MTRVLMYVRTICMVYGNVSTSDCISQYHGKFCIICIFSGSRQRRAIVIYGDSDIVCVENIFALHFFPSFRQSMLLVSNIL